MASSRAHTTQLFIVRVGNAAPTAPQSRHFPSRGCPAARSPFDVAIGVQALHVAPLPIFEDAPYIFTGRRVTWTATTTARNAAQAAAPHAIFLCHDWAEKHPAEKRRRLNGRTLRSPDGVPSYRKPPTDAP
eukprot:366047-Chlamydomonas_euryale.AAC.3